MSVPYPFIVGSAKLTIRASPPRVFEALLNPQDLAAWWSPDAFVDAQLDGRYETNPPEGRQEGFIIALDAPRRISFTWPVLEGEKKVDSSVAYELSPKGPETVVHVAHHARTALSRDWNPTWQKALEALRTFLESETAGSPEGIGDDTAG